MIPEKYRTISEILLQGEIRKADLVKTVSDLLESGLGPIHEISCELKAMKRLDSWKFLTKEEMCLINNDKF